MLQADPYLLRYLAQQIVAGVDRFNQNADRVNDSMNRLLHGKNGWKGEGASMFEQHGEILVSEIRKASKQLADIPPVLFTLASRVEYIQSKQRELEELQNHLNEMHFGLNLKNDAEIAYLEGRIFALRGEIEFESKAADVAATVAFDAIRFSESLQEQLQQLSQTASTVIHKTEEIWDKDVKPAGEWLLNGVEEFLSIPEMEEAWRDLTNPNLTMGERLLAAGKIVAYGALDVSMLFGVGEELKGVQLLAKFGAKYGAKLFGSLGRKEMIEASTKSLSEFADDLKSGTEKEISDADRTKLQNWKYAPNDELYLDKKEVYDNPKYYDQETGEINWPGTKGDPNIDGFVNGEYQIETLKPGTVIDRYGSNSTGKYFSPVGSSYESRALPPHMKYQPYSKYRIIKEFQVRSGKIAPWFDEVGEGTQYYSKIEILDDYGELCEATVKNLLKYNYIEEIIE